MTYYGRIVEKESFGKTLYQPQIKMKCCLSLFFFWKPLFMINYEFGKKRFLRMWTDNYSEATERLDRYSTRHNIKIELIN